MTHEIIGSLTPCSNSANPVQNKSAYYITVHGVQRCTLWGGENHKIKNIAQNAKIPKIGLIDAFCLLFGLSPVFGIFHKNHIVQNAQIPKSKKFCAKQFLCFSDTQTAIICPDLNDIIIKAKCMSNWVKSVHQMEAILNLKCYIFYTFAQNTLHKNHKSQKQGKFVVSPPPTLIIMVYHRR